MKLDLGGGGKKHAGFKSVDLDGRADIYCDIRKLSFAEDNSIEEIMSIHAIEHLYYWEVPDFLKECYRVLQPGGKIAIECPDFDKCIDRYVKNRKDEVHMWAIFGNPKKKSVLMCHKWGWKPDTLKKAMEEAGFKDVQLVTAKYHQPERDLRMEGIK